MSKNPTLAEKPRSRSSPVTVDTDLDVHMLATYKALRLTIVVVTVAFLLTLTIYRESGCDPVHRQSISAYYYHNDTDFRMKDVFVGSLVAVALLVITYQGYTDRENWALNFGGFGLLCVVAFPMDWDAAKNEAGPLTIRGVGHYAGAFLFFGTVAYVCLYRAHDTLGRLQDGPGKTAYKNAYRTIGICLCVVPVAAAVLGQIVRDGWVYYLEVSGVLVFVVYWLVKSRELSVSQTETPSGVREATEEAVGPGGTSGTDPKTRT